MISKQRNLLLLVFLYSLLTGCVFTSSTKPISVVGKNQQLLSNLTIKNYVDRCVVMAPRQVVYRREGSFLEGVLYSMEPLKQCGCDSFLLDYQLQEKVQSLDDIRWEASKLVAPLLGKSKSFSVALKTDPAIYYRGKLIITLKCSVN
ncbi:DUF2195 family protein [Zooshikella ganghwensis]|uniref:DUF2195 family protein n=1 Tax=Zooshikella ganghwensis TaxID=202772 RepID=A0A4P9VR21_9GAMM|nr:DUF2195 family protein [Zooshikella ganghwensis]RDH46003.1 DUF2195 family protein [Zooshikella ganghwensis]